MNNLETVPNAFKSKIFPSQTPEQEKNTAKDQQYQKLKCLN